MYDMRSEEAHIVDITQKVCFSDNEDCAINTPVMKPQKLPKLHCTWNEDPVLPG